MTGLTDGVYRHVVPGTLRLCRYHGQHRILDTTAPLEYDIVISTYGTVASDLKYGGGVLGQFNWYRLILDEGIRHTS